MRHERRNDLGDRRVERALGRLAADVETPSPWELAALARAAVATPTAPRRHRRLPVRTFAAGAAACAAVLATSVVGPALQERRGGPETGTVQIFGAEPEWAAHRLLDLDLPTTFQTTSKETTR